MAKPICTSPDGRFELYDRNTLAGNEFSAKGVPMFRANTADFQWVIVDNTNKNVMSIPTKKRAKELVLNDHVQELAH